MVGSSPSPELHRHNRSPWKWRLYYAFLAICLLYIILTGLVASLTKHTPISTQVEEEEWISSSHYWLDRQLCRWIGCCGTFHMLNHGGWTWPVKEPDLPLRQYHKFWHSGARDSDDDDWSDDERERRTIPDYVLQHAPYVHLFSGETYWPSDIAEHLVHTAPFSNHSHIGQLDRTRNLTNLDEMNDFKGSYQGRDVYLHSDDNIEELPTWLRSDYNIPSQVLARSSSIMDDSGHQQPLDKSTDARCGGTGSTTCRGTVFGQCCSIFGWCGSDGDHCSGNCDPQFGHCHGPHMPGKYGPRTDLKKRALPKRGMSGAPAILIVVPKADGIVDAFWFFFYSYNQGKQVLDIRFGNHVGDWEHTMIRFQHGKPTYAFLSAHSWGAAFTFDALEKYAFDLSSGSEVLSSWRNVSMTTQDQFKRPVVFSADGSHAMYATSDYHDYVAPFGILHDDTDRGPLWDPVMNLKSFMYDVNADVLRPSMLNPDAPTGWFHYAGRWGDRYYLLSDPRQYRFAGEYHYVSGPQGPKFKNLGRKHPCLRPDDCKIATSVRRATSFGTIHVSRAEGEMSACAN